MARMMMRLRGSKFWGVLAGASLVLLVSVFVWLPPRLGWVESTRYKLLLYDDGTVALFHGARLEQTFTANYPGLSGIDILFDRNNLGPGQSIVFRLRTSCTSTGDLVYQAIEMPPLPQPAFHPFTFPPIDTSAGQSYCLVLEAPRATPQQAVQLKLSTGNLYPFGDLTLSTPEPTPAPTALPPSTAGLKYKTYLPFITLEPVDHLAGAQDIGFQLHYDGLLLPTAAVFVTRLIAGKPSLLGLPWFYAGLLFVYILLLAGLFYLVRQIIRLNWS